MPQTRFVPGGRIVEEFIPDEPDDSGYHGFSGDRPMLAFDMFGQINTGDPKIELARRMAAQRHDEAEAQASAKARFDAPRFVPGLAEQPDSVEAIDRELFQPIRREYGVPDPTSNRIIPPSNIPVSFDRDPNKEYITKGGALIPKIKPDASEFETRRMEVPASPGSQAIEARPFRQRNLFGIPFLDRFLPDEPAVEARAAVPPHDAYIATRRVRIGNDSFAPSSNVSTNEVIKIAPNGKRAVFDADTKKFLRYAD